MIETVENYLENHAFYDLRLLSTLGFEQEDVELFEQKEDVEAAEGGLSFDIIYRMEGGNQGVARVYSLAERVNTVKLVAGRMPEQPDECVADSAIFGEGALGSVLYLSEDNTEEDREHFVYSSYKIVGLVQSPLYLQYERGNTSLGNGRIDGFVCLMREGFDEDFFTEVYVKLRQEHALYSQEYDDLIEEKTGLWEEYAGAAADRRYSAILADAGQEIADAEQELADKRAEGEAELADAAAELADARKQLAEGEAELADGVREIADNEATLKEKEAEIADARKQLSEGEAELADAQAQIAEGETELAEGEATLKEKEAEIADARKQLAAGEAKLADARAELEAGEAELADAKAQLEAGDAELAAGEALLKEKEAELTAGEALLKDKETELAAGEAELEDARKQWKEGSEELESARREAQEGRKQLNAGRQQISEEKEKLQAMAAAGLIPAEQLQAGMAVLEAKDSELDAIEAKLDQADAAVAQGTRELSESLEKLEKAEKELEEGRGALEGAWQEIEEGRGALTAAWQEIEEGRGALAAGRQEIEDGREALDDGWREFEDGRAELEAGWREFEEGEAELADAREQLEEGIRAFEDGEAELADARAEIADGEKALKEGWEKLNEAKEDVRQGEEELVSARQELADGEREYEDALREFREKTGDAEAEIADAKKELEDLESPEAYVLGRDTNIGYVCFESDSNIVEGIANIFPIFFFLVAALVCVTTMNRMVEEQRTQIGVLKALGYGKHAIMSKYMIYSGLAALAGCVSGFLAGTWGFPKVIWFAYGIMYHADPIVYVFGWGLAAVSLAVSLLCSIGTTWLSCRAELKEAAATLMRPKAPKAGKRIFLESLPFLWNRLGFLRKVSLRNIFRYKKRLFMMVLGISGCTALLVTGFGIEDSIGDVADRQFGEIQTYDIGVMLKESADGEFTAKLDELAPRYGIEAYAPVMEKTFDFVAAGGVKPVYLVVGTAESMPDPQAGEAVISNKLSETYRISAGDTVTLRDGDMRTLTLTVSGVYENYINNYVQISEETWRQLMGTEPERDTVYLNIAEDADAHSLSAALMGLSEVSSVTVNADTMKRVGNMMESLDVIVVVVVLCAAGLAFIVLYNLTNINITERIREIATIKVLGFYRKETAAYVFRENILLTVLGALLGLLLGNFLHRFVMSQIQVDLISFDVYIRPLSYGYSVLLTLAFTLLVNWVMGGKLEKISMTESLKSVD